MQCDIPFYVEYSNLYVLFTLLGKRGVTLPQGERKPIRLERGRHARNRP